MNPVPNDPSASARPASIVPMFPLPGLFLFPGTALPLHIFEPRYKQMVEDLLDRSGRFVLATVLPTYEKELAATPPVHPIAGLGEIVRHERLDEGRFAIFVVGLGRVRLEEVPSDRLYRQVAIHPLSDRPVPPDDAPTLRRDLTAALKVRAKGIPLPADIPLGQLVDLLLLHLRLDSTTMLDLYSRLDIADRGRAALERHLALPTPPPQQPPTPDAPTPE